ncbi:RNA polymerase factor sigma-54 [Pseudoprimorskyibacter insulae]|uniref:RNA polymerase sigma-54 factor n=1 Tax=Pseudoprimorskyibacter insulae TaxID=1695997 RepID=A0A2R8AVP5_9RHOB|nr:RNA polymerase factor sigma-54 [Pseudoprimorskyibacter insulae]SPF80098.1 RNA polymerase sigma-54 factor 1 [Pseudoprimorskyibacter insulae]
MNLHVSQNLSQRQSMVMTAQLQQAICLLQLSNLDLRAYLESEAEENPFVDVAGGETAQHRDLGLPMSRGAASDFDYISDRAEAPAPSLYTHVSGQFDVMFTNPRDRMVAEQFLEALEPNGWLGEPLEAIAMRCVMSSEEAEEMLHLVQQVEPAGLFARSLAECLAIQAEDRGLMTPLFAALLENLPKLAAADLAGLCRVCKCTMDELKDCLKSLRSLNPKPGADFDHGELTQREPDLIVTRGDDGWRVDLNRSTLPSVKVDETKAQDVRRDRSAGEYVGERLSVARWLRRAVEHRNHTTLSVGAEIVRRQAEFLEHGPSRIEPMTLKDVAEAIGVHESTVSRITTGMLIVTPQGTFSLKNFFTTALSTDGEGAASSASVRHRIQQLVRDEDPKKPLSDDALAQIISDEGTHLARRTVAKYRDMLKIPSSFQRKRQAKLASS